ncbi:molybdopterin oxidoreductase [Spirochaetia bacterium]|nr:molybdopterin oxidoreductase [Spirochaetia bacterium]
MKELTCIVCPIGCSLNVEEGAPGADGFASLTISGNRCPRGAAYAREEIRSPRRVVTATCAIAEESIAGSHSAINTRRIPVKTSAPCPREKIDELLKEVYHTKVKLPVNSGDKIIADWQGSGIDIVAVRAVEG